MSDRLLTAEDIIEAWSLAGNIEIAKAQDAQTLKAVAEWLAETCDSKFHLIWVGKQRSECPLCLANLLEATEDGQMPDQSDGR
ncbi:hypothetical protein LCGC14_2310660 [marine sediment metagenome]|uniref:Uncharacterized protein n=1 Tax=marine sediment metagenome TaxID=412755 RepID=A0A0F9FFM8_9ZZZZ